MPAEDLSDLNKQARRSMTLFSRDNHYCLLGNDNGKLDQSKAPTDRQQDGDSYRKDLQKLQLSPSLLSSIQPPSQMDSFLLQSSGRTTSARSMESLSHPLKRIDSCLAPKSVYEGRQSNKKVPLPQVLQYENHVLQEYDSSGEDMTHYEELSTLLPHISKERMVSVEPQVLQGFQGVKPRLRIGLILSGGPAPGGHNVIAGAFDYLKQRNKESQLIGFIGGLDGFLDQRYEIMSSQRMDEFRNLGGFNMLWSGRGRINGDYDLELAVSCANNLELDGLIIIGGDGTNSNAAIIANHFARMFDPSCTFPGTKLNKMCCVIGIPKTVDGDVNSKNIEISFGFDTAAKTYSELIGNLCTDASSTQYNYHFVRVMGRSASHLALECALQTHPNMVLIGEEVEHNQQSLRSIVDSIVEVIEKRHAMGKPFGVILIPEGLIEFIPDMRVLIKELNDTLKDNPKSGVDSSLLKNSKDTWEFMPESIREQLINDIEAGGYIMVAKIATERLLSMLVESRMVSKGSNLSGFTIMTHYFGYEGRCAIPSGFDASYCYALGYNAGVLISNGRNGYMSVIRNLNGQIEDWIPIGVPFLHLMEVKGETRYPAIRKTLLNLDGQLFHTFSKVREIWAYQDVYRSPGPIQTDTGLLTVKAPLYISSPTVGDLVGDLNAPRTNKHLNFKHTSFYSDLQRTRLNVVPEIPSICSSLQATMQPFKQVFDGDQYLKNQILLNYPYLVSHSKFNLYEVILDHSKDSNELLSTIDENNNGSYDPLRVGIVPLSKHAPGIVNVIWGVFERVSLLSGKCFAFHGAKGLTQGDYIELEDRDFDYLKNLGGLELVHRSKFSYFYEPENWEKALNSCKALDLDGLIILGDEGSMTQASLLTEYFLNKKSKTCVIGVPVAGSNSLGNSLIESCVGFDSNARIYASLVGNVLTDAVSMPKYWHFVKILGRYPSLEVLECAMQTHPNVVIIAEEYGSADKTLFDVVQDIADAVCKRAEIGKNFGTVLIPDHLVLHLPNTKTMLYELRRVVMEATYQGKKKEVMDQLAEYSAAREGNNGVSLEGLDWVRKITPWSLAVFDSLPPYIRNELLQIDFAEVALERIEIEIMLAKMVKEELNLRKERGEYSGNYAAVTHYFGYQGRCSIPSEFDCSLAYAYGHMAAIALENKLTGYCCSIRGLCGSIQDWKLFAIPFTSLMKIAPDAFEIFSMEKFKKGEMPVIPTSNVDLQSKAFRKFKVARKRWLLDDLFTNPGPIQFDGFVGTQSMVLITEFAEYYYMLRSVEKFSDALKNSCKFGVSEEFLNHVFIQLWGLVKIAQKPGELITLAQEVHGALDKQNEEELPQS
ncbi:phosphofructokinase, putative [Theileria equi strain WA]|uniref:Probable ATP-dependent 6-phosphofructokinase n=1 Tax=Theileria equi strain WA TaxID=1537102 RepID=L0AWB4_THEEQ|nr:phosphofructokinase, putative [Theileria equi strain WA]AFZ79533.1 phosphofructokinase, putative [Theileria equi strain WA]|eukprot:XP_004829199.1 phosphofructokinase, putative [Theileria equi strain WA]